MRLLMAAGILLLCQQPDFPDKLIMTNHGKIVMKADPAELSVPFLPLIDQRKLDAFTQRVARKVYKAPVNARIGHSGTIRPGKNGETLERHQFKKQLYHHTFSHNQSKLKLPLLTLYPKVDEELLSQVREQRISSYQTFFNAGNKSRSHNIELAAKALDSHVVFPNEIFSFNQTVGMRTKAKGYLSAKIIVRGEYAEGIGGGICQVSSTLFNAVDRAGLKIVERYSHSKRVAYVPEGRDATVSWYGPDFRFKNTSNQPVLIRAHKYGGTIAFALYSSDMIQLSKRNVPEASKRVPKEIKKETEGDKTQSLDTP
ncbi:VanW family protein [Sporolactobacillus terrae]|uniref:VanW family protein n=1 Tax=Sporolactobacillus terrae TaxID=269673 RepID=UPI00048E5DBE|nr:VanW family protein [Sporolactobacillus terrae]